MGELINLEWDDVNLNRKVIVVRPKEFWKPEGKEERAIPTHDVVSYILMNKKRRSNWVFTKADGGKVNIHSLETKFR